jgi:hypothetical protein
MSTRFIQSDDPIVTDLLASTIELVAEAGGWIAPSISIVCSKGQLHIESLEVDDSPLFHIPSQAFVRVDDVLWSDSSEQLEILDIPDHFDDIETELLYIQVALHNQCGKLSWMTKTHPWLAEDVPDEVIEAVRQILPSFREPRITATDALWANRCFKIAINESQEPQRVLIPLVDLLNHHNLGTTGLWTGDAFDVASNAAFGSNECALNYGLNRGALEMAAVYGFIDNSECARQPTDTKPPLVRRLEHIIEVSKNYPGSIACSILAHAARIELQSQ